MSETKTKPPAFSKHSHELQAQSYEDLLVQDTRAVPEFIRHFGEPEVGPAEVPTRWYTDHAVYRDEIENIWKRTWQMVCRTDHLRSVGDTYVYDICGMSFVLVRDRDQQIKGYWNSCLHRGATLRTCAGRVDRLQCPFHGFTWGLDGESLLIPHPEEFPHIDKSKFSLPRVQVGIWQDFVFINPDLEAGPLENFVAPLESQFSRVPFTGRELALHVVKEFPANWKAVHEAFMESFHVLTTHPQFALAMAERCTDYGYVGNVSRGVVTVGQTNDYVPFTPDEQQIFRAQQEFWDDEEGETLAEGETARQALVERARNLMRPAVGTLADEVSDTEAVDLYYYTLFPNFGPYGVFGQPMVYRFLPHGTDPDRSTMEVWFLTPLPEGVEAREPAKPVYIGDDEDFTAFEAWGSFGAFLAQDSANIGGMMAGLRNNQTGIVNFARKYESMIRHFYSLYEQAMHYSAANEVTALKAARVGKQS